MMIYKPPSKKFITTTNPKIRVLIANKSANKKTTNSKFKNLMAEIITDVEYNFDVPDEQLIQEISVFEEIDSEHTKTPLSIKHLPTTTNILKPTSSTSINTSNSHTYQRGRFHVTDSYSELDKMDKIESAINITRMIKSYNVAKDNLINVYDNLLKKNNQLWNIIIPYYSTNSGNKCGVIIEHDYYYYQHGTQKIQFGIDFMLRNFGLFVEVIPKTKEIESWINVSDTDPRTIIESYGFQFVKDTQKYWDLTVSDSLKFTFIDIVTKPPVRQIRDWSCNNYEHLYNMLLNKDNKMQKPINQVLEYEYNIYNNVEDFQTSEWFDRIKLNPIDCYINSDSKNSNITSHVITYKHICEELRKNSMNGFTKMDLWLFFEDEIKFEAEIIHKPMDKFESISNNHSQLDTYFSDEYSIDMGTNYDSSTIYNGYQFPFSSDDEYDDVIDCSKIPDTWHTTMN